MGADKSQLVSRRCDRLKYKLESTPDSLLDVTATAPEEGPTLFYISHMKRLCSSLQGFLNMRVHGQQNINTIVCLAAHTSTGLRADPAPIQVTNL